MANVCRIACYNMYGFKNGCSGLLDLCKSADIIAIEELFGGNGMADFLNEQLSH